MSAGFNVGDTVFWGTNGAVEAYVEVLAAEAADRLGPNDPLTAFFQQEREQFFTGKVVFLDEWTADVNSRGRLLELLEAGAETLLQSEMFSSYGREWIASMMTDLHACLADSSTPNDRSLHHAGRLL